MQLIEVTTPKLAKLFLEVAVKLYKNDSLWIRPLDKDLIEVFDEKKNKTFRHGKLIRWILKSESGELVGRIAAFTNKKYKNPGDNFVVGGIGFFECIDNQSAANILFDAAKNWLEGEDVQAMDGPINFGERDRWWGLVIKKFESPLYCMNYNPEYYIALFENYGFKQYFDQVCFDMLAKKPLTKKILERHAALEKTGEFSSAIIDKNNLSKFADDFVTVYNKAWAGHGGLKQLDRKQAVFMFEKMKPVMDEKIVWFAYHKQEPIAIFINIPDLNHWFKYMNGKFGLLQKLKFLWVKKFIPNKKFVGVVFGVAPEWQGKGVDAFIITESAKLIQHPSLKYEDYEMQWIGDFNPKMLNVATSLGAVKEGRMLRTYRYIFDTSVEVKRHPILK